MKEGKELILATDDGQPLLEAQRGLITRRQALLVLSQSELKWRLRSGQWGRVHPGVYKTHNGPLNWYALAQAALLGYGKGAALAGHAAAYIWRLEQREPSVIEVVVPHIRTPARLPGTRLRRHRNHTHAVAARGGFPVTGASDTVLDLAGSAQATADDAIAVAARAVQRKIASVEELADELAARRGHRNRRALELGLGVVARGAESVLEVGFDRGVITAHGLPPMAMAQPDEVAGRSVRRDFRSDEYLVIAEVDGQIGHDGEFRRLDSQRDRWAAAMGDVTVRAGWIDVMDLACELAADLYAVFRARGYTGALQPCGPDCRATAQLIRLQGSTG